MIGIRPCNAGFPEQPHFAQKLGLTLLAAALGVGLCATSALAHHTSSVAKVGGAQGSGQRGGAMADALPAPRLDIGLVHDIVYFDRVLQGTEVYTKGELGSVLLNLVTLAAQLELGSGTRLGVLMPAGMITTSPAGSATSSAVGMGDLQVFVGQDLGSFWRARPVELALRVGGALPTGDYERGTGLSLTDLSGSEDGSLDLITYNIRASLGAGVSSLVGLAELTWRAHTRVRLQASAGVLYPVSSTEEDIRWGEDVHTSMAISLEVLRGALAVGGGAHYRWHARDEAPVVDEESGLATSERVGGRHEAIGSIAAHVRFHPRIICSLRAHVPFWQRVGGIQLVETLSATTSCTFGIGL